MLHDWFNKCSDMYYYVCGTLHIKDSLLLIEKSSYLSGPLQYVWRHKTLNKNVLGISLNKIPSYYYYYCCDYYFYNFTMFILSLLLLLYYYY